jgi:small GTP-binding protein
MINTSKHSTTIEGVGAYTLKELYDYIHQNEIAWNNRIVIIDQNFFSIFLNNKYAQTTVEEFMSDLFKYEDASTPEAMQYIINNLKLKTSKVSPPKPSVKEERFVKNEKEESAIKKIEISTPNASIKTKKELIEVYIESEKIEANFKSLQTEMHAKANEALTSQKRIRQIVILGDGGVGKTALLNRYFLDKFNPMTKLKFANYYFTIVENNDIENFVFFWDVMGQERARFLQKFFSQSVDAVILCYDLTRSKSVENLDNWITLGKEVNDKDIPFLLVGLKSDLKEKIEVTELQNFYNNRLGEKVFLLVSSKSGINVKSVFNNILSKINSDYELNENELRLIKKKLKLFEYLDSYKVQGKEEVIKYTKEHFTESLVEEFNNIDVATLLMFEEFRVKIQNYITELLKSG